MNSSVLTSSVRHNPSGPSGRRVAIIYRLYQPGGVQSVVLSLVKGLNAQGIVPDLVWDTPPSARLLAEKNLRVGFARVRFAVPSALLDQLPITAAYLLRMLNVFSTQDLPKPYDFYYIFYNGFLVKDGTPHIRYLSGPPLIRALEAIRPGWRGLPFRVANFLYTHLLRHWLPAYEFHRNSHYVINSDFTAQLFEAEHGVRLPVVHPPIDLAGRSFSEADLSQRDTITFFSRFVDFKRPELFLELAGRHPQQRFVLMGGVKPPQRAYYERLRQAAERLRQGASAPNITFFENPSDARVKEELARTWVYVFPTIDEHFGMATAEAIGSGAIPYVHDSGGQREIVTDPRLRFQDEQFFERFEKILRLPPEAVHTIRCEARENVERFSEDAFIEKMLSYLK